jgi:lipoprotein-anchoring transpeptidase ErfK/SrfK
MIPRAAIGLVILVLAGLTEAAAQYDPPAPYRTVPRPYDEFLYLTEVPAPAPYQRAPLPPPNSEPRSYDPRLGRPPAPGRIARRPFLAPRDDGEFVPRPPAPIGSRHAPDTTPPAPTNLAALPPEYRPEQGAQQLAPRFHRQIVDYRRKAKPGTVIIDTQRTYLYFVLGHRKAIRYGIGVGRAGFTWSGRHRISRMAEWPDWYPPEDMIARQPYLPRMMAGGPGNPLGARALYLGKSLYRIHGTNQPSTIGKFVSSGCIRLLNEDVIDLYQRVRVGTRVVVLPGRPPEQAARR